MRGGWVVAAVVLSGSTAARAQYDVSREVLPETTPRTSAVEFKFGALRPMLDSEAGLTDPATGGTATPFKDIFGNKRMLLFELELDQYLYQGIGAAGLAISAGYAEIYGQARILNDDGTTTPSTVEATGLFMVPIRLGGVYRFDWAALNYRIPLVPYVKAGLIYAPWWVTQGGRQEVVEGRTARGGTWGYGGTLGLSFLLDILEPRLARDFDADLGVNHSYLFAEFTYANVDDFGRGGFNLSTRHFMFGLALEF